MSGINYLLDLLRMARRGEDFALPPQAGGTGRDDGFAQGVVATAFNVSGSTISRGTVVKMATDDQSPGVGVTPTTATSDSPYGVALEDIAAGEAGPVARSGGPVYVLTEGSVSVGSLLYPSATAGRATATAGTGAAVARSRTATSGTSSAWTDLTSTGGAGNDHGTLGGLADDDHSQYLNEARHDAHVLMRHAHGLFLAAWASSAGEDLHWLISDDGITFTDPLGAPPTGLIGNQRDPSWIHWDGAIWLAHTIGDENDFRLMKFTEIGAGVHVGDIVVDASGTQTWAPEWARNADGTPLLHPTTGLPFLLVAVSTDNKASFSLREIHPTSRAMTTWSAPVTISGTGFGTLPIDPFLLYVPEFEDGTPYKLFFKDDSGKFILYAESAALTTGYTTPVAGDWAGWKSPSASIEAICVTKIDDGRWRAYFVHNSGFNAVATYYSDSTDDWGTWTARAATVTPELMNHGTIQRLPSAYDHARDAEAHRELFDNLTTDHGELLGLGDDDHTQYLTDNRHDIADHSAFRFVGEILTSDTPSNPLVFADLIQNEAQDDLVYADAG